MFTSRSIFLLFAVILLLVVAWNTDITMVYIFFVVAFVTFVLSFIHHKINVPDLVVSRDVHETAYENDMTAVKLNVRNKSKFKTYFFEIIDKFPGAPPEEDEPSLFILNMASKGHKKLSYLVSCHRRGLWRFGPINVVSQDALGFFKSKKSIQVYSDILVYPAIFRIYSFPKLASGSVSWMGVETAKISGDSHEFFGVREYQRGDAISRIHWSSTARHNKLIVKQFERNAVQEVTIVIDLKKENNIGSGKETTLEYAVKIASSISRYLMREGVFVQLVGYGKKATIIPFGKGESHMFRILEFLARVQPDGSASLTQTLEEASFVAPARSTLIAIMLDNDINAIASLVQFKAKGIKLIAIVLSASTFGSMSEEQYLDSEAAKNFEEGLASLEASIYRISKGDDLEKKFEIA